MTKATPSPPRRAPSSAPTAIERHGVRVEDHYAWLRDKGYPKVDDKDVLDYLKAENAYFEAAMKPHAGARRDTVPGDEGPHQGRRFLGPARGRRLALLVGVQARHAIPLLVPQAGRRRPRPAHLRRKCRGRGQGIFPPRRFRRQPRRQALATLVDDDGSERFKLVVRDLATGKSLETVTKVGIGNPVWTNDSNGLVFTEVNDQWRSYRARYHVIGRPLAETKTLYEEKDDIAFSVGVSRSPTTA